LAEVLSHAAARAATFFNCIAAWAMSSGLAPEAQSGGHFNLM
jgi:hypothetical protein